MSCPLVYPSPLGSLSMNLLSVGSLLESLLLINLPTASFLLAGSFFGLHHFLSIFDSQILSLYLLINMSLFFPISIYNYDKLTLLHNHNNSCSTFLILSPPISYSLPLPLLLRVFKPKVAEPNSTFTSRNRNRKDRRGEKDGRDIHTSWTNIRGERITKKFKQNISREDLKLETFQPWQKNRNKGMTSQKKLFLICECYTYSDKYKTFNKITFCKTI